MSKLFGEFLHECIYLLLGVGVRAQAEVYIVQVQSGRALGVLAVLAALDPHTSVMVSHMKDAHSLGIQGQGVPQDGDLPGGPLVGQGQSWVLDRGNRVGPIQEILSEQSFKEIG